MPQLSRIPALSRLLNYLQLSLVKLSFLPFAFIVTSFLFVLVISFLWAYIWACLIFKIFSLSMKLMILVVTLIIAPKPLRVSNVGENIRVLNDKEGYNLDPWELRPLHRSEEMENAQKADEREPRSLRTSDNSWQFLLPPQATKWEEQKSFYEILAFWRKKERRAIEENNGNKSRLEQQLGS